MPLQLGTDSAPRIIQTPMSALVPTEITCAEIKRTSTVMPLIALTFPIRREGDEMATQSNQDLEYARAKAPSGE
jgi:hypothetical protein